MDYYSFVMEARQAPGFGGRPPPKKPSKEQLTIWYAKSEKWRTGYLKRHPNSMFKDAKAGDPNKDTGRVLSRSKKMLKNSAAMALVQGASDALKGWGVKGGKITRDKAIEMHRNIKKFLKEDRSKTIDKAKGIFEKFMAKLPRKDRDDIDEEAKKIANRPGTRASKILAGTKAKLPAILGMAAKIAIFGVVASGVIPPDVIAFMGVKILDGAITAFRGTVGNAGGGLTAFITGEALSNYFQSKDADRYANETKDKMAKAHNIKDEDEKTDEDTIGKKPGEEAKISTDEKKAGDGTATKDKATNADEKPKENSPADDPDLKKAGIKLDPKFYYQDENGDWKRKKG